MKRSDIRTRKWKSAMNVMYRIGLLLIGLGALSPSSSSQTGNATRGERLYRACVACHSLEPNRNMTGPSLAELWNRQAGSLATFDRYSEALKSSGIIWQDTTLDPWIADPQHFVAGTTMTFPGMKDAQQRADFGIPQSSDPTRPCSDSSTRQPDGRHDGNDGRQPGAKPQEACA
jgi:cytochrome c